MKYHSTRNKASTAVSASQAITQGLAADGGLFVPESWPTTFGMGEVGATDVGIDAAGAGRAKADAVEEGKFS